MANTIKIKRRTDASDTNELGTLSVGELGVDLTDNNKLYVGSSSGNQLLNPTASTNADTLDSIDSANFIRSDNNVTVNSTDSNGYSRITVNNGSAQLGLFRSGNSAGGGYLGFDSTNFTVYDGSFNTRLAINTSSGNATFGGTITATGGTLTGRLTVADTSGADGLVIAGGENTGISARLFFETGTSGQGTSILNVGGGFQFRTGATAGSSSGAERMHLSSGGTLYPQSNGQDLGTSTKRWELKATSGNFSGQAEFQNKLHLIGLTLDSSQTPSYIKIKTKIPFASSAADFTVNIKGFQYGSARTVDLKICWHYYNSTFYNATISSAGGWLPTAQLSAEDDNGTDMVCIVLASPGYWPKMYVESAYSKYYGSSTNYFTGWTWTDAAASGTGNKLVTLQYNNKFGNVQATGTLSVSGTSTFYGSLDLQDNDKLLLGNGNDLEIYHDGSNSYIKDAGTGSLLIEVAGTGDSGFYKVGGEKLATFEPDGPVSLYHNNAKKFETTSYGADITGRLVTTSHIDVPDNARIRLGDGDDLQIYHDGSNSYIKEASTGDIILDTNSNIRFKSSTEHLISAAANGAVELYYDNSKKFETTSTGATVYGSVTANALYASTNGVALGTSSNGWRLYSNNADVSGTLTVDGTSNLSSDESSWVNIGNKNAFKRHNTFLYFGNGGFSGGAYTSINIRIADGYNVSPYSNAASASTTLGTSSYRWPTIYGAAGDFSGSVSVGGALDCIKSGTNILTIQGSSSGYVNAGISLRATSDTHYRGLGVFMHDAGGDTEWFAGRPYADSDKYIIARKASQASHSTATAQNANALFTIYNSGNVAIKGIPYPTNNNTYTLGTSASRWSTIYGVAGDFSGNLTVGGHTNAHSTSTISASSKIDSADLSLGAFRIYNTSGFRGGLGTGYWASGAGADAVNLSLYVQGDNDFDIWTNNVKRAIFNSTGLSVNSGSVLNSANSEVDIQLPDEGGIAMGAAYTYANVYGKSGDLHLRANSYPANTGSTSKIYLSTSTSSGGQASDVIVEGGALRLANGNSLHWDNENTRILASHSSQYIRFDVGGTSNVLKATPNSVNFTSVDGSGLIINRTSATAKLQLFPSYSNVPTIMGKGAGGLHLSYNSSSSGIRIDTSNNVTVHNNLTVANNKILSLGTTGNNTGKLRFFNNNSTAHYIDYESTGARSYRFHGSSSGSAYTTYFNQAGTGGHNIHVAGNISLAGNGVVKQIVSNAYATADLNNWYTGSTATLGQYYRYDATHGHFQDAAGNVASNAPNTLTHSPTQVYSYGALLTLGTTSSFRGQFYMAHSASEIYWRSGWGSSGDQNWTRLVGDRNIQSVINSVGNISIGGAPSAAGKLTIHTGTNTNGLLIYEDTDDSLTHNLYIDGNDQGVLDLRNNSNAVKVQLHSGGHSFFTGGSLGIGTTVPYFKCDIHGGSSVPLRLVSSGYAGTEFHNTAGTWVAYVGTESGGGGNRYNSAASKHTFYNNSSAAVTIDSTGLGVGVTAPSAKLHVNKTGVGDNEIAEVIRLSTLNSASPTWGTADGLCIGAEMKKANGTTITKQPIKFRYDGGDMATTLEEGRVGIGESAPWTGLHLKSQTFSGFNGLTYNLTIASSNTYSNGHAGGILFAGAYNTSETQTSIAGVWASRPNAGNGQYGGMVHIGGRQHGTSNIPKVINVNHEAVSINTVSPIANTKLHVNGTTYSTAYNTAYTFEWSGRTAYFANGSSGLVSKLNFGNNQMWGWIEVSLTDAYSHSPSTGKLTRLYEIGHNQSTSYHYANGKVTESYGNVRGQWKLGDLELVSNNVTIPIIHRTTAGNAVTVHVRGMLHSSNGANILNDISLSTPAVGSYNTDIQYAEIADMAMSGTNGRIRNDSGNTIIDNDGELVRIPGIAVNHSTPGTHGLYVKDKTSYLKGNVGIGASPSYTLDVYKSVTGNWLSRIHNTATSGNSSGLLVRMDEPGSTGKALGVNVNGSYKLSVNADGDVDIAQKLGVGGTHDGTYGLYVHSTTWFNDDVRIGGEGSTSSHKLYWRDATNGDEWYAHYDGALKFVESGSATRLTLKDGGQIQLNSYGSSGLTGTVAKYLAVDSSGNVIQADGTSSSSGSGTVSSSTTTSGTTNGNVAIYTASTTVKQAAKLFYNGSDDSLTVGQTSSNGTAQFNVIGDGYFSTRIGVGSSPNSSYSAFFSGDIYCNGDIGGYSKSFRIPHPTKEGMNLRHSSLEGPEIGVYQRGEIQGDTITLPDYWAGLVRDGTVTVQLTPKGSFQQLYVVSASNTEVRIAEANGADIDCYYTIYGERADVDRYDVEYEGQV